MRKLCYLILVLAMLSSLNLGMGLSASTDGIGDTAALNADTPDPDLQVWYKFDEDDGTARTAADSSPNGYTATLANTTSQTRFDDVGGRRAVSLISGGNNTVTNNGYLTLPNTIFENVPGDFTITMMMYFRSGGTWVRLLDFGPDSTGNIINVTAGEIQVRVDGGQSLSPPPRLNNTGTRANMWRPVTITHSVANNETIIYMNGIEAARGTQIAPLNRTPGGNFYIGRSTSANADPFPSMALSDFRIYSRALSPAEVADFYADYVTLDMAIAPVYLGGEPLPPVLAGYPVTWSADDGSVADGKAVHSGQVVFQSATVTASFGGVNAWEKSFNITILPSDYWTNTTGTVTLDKSTGNNPISFPHHTGDPAPVVVDDTVWVIGGLDNPGVSYDMPAYVAYSSKDLVNWEYHGVILDLVDVPWLSNSSAWAAQMIPYNGKYHLFICGWGNIDADIGGNPQISATHLGVAVADHPAGPYIAHPEPILYRTQTMPQSNNYNDIDPTVWIETIDGVERGYIAWGNGRLYVAELNEDMLSIKDRNGDGKVNNFDAVDGLYDIENMLDAGKWNTKSGVGTTVNYTEAPWLYKRNGIYYMFYDGGGTVGYARSDNVFGPWWRASRVMGATSTSATNHSGVIDFNGKTYLFNHNGMLPNAGSFGRSPCIMELRFDDLGFAYPMSEISIGLGGTASAIRTAGGAFIGHATFTSNSTALRTARAINVNATGTTVALRDWEIIQGRGNSGAAFVSIQSVHKPGGFITATSETAAQLQQDFYGAGLRNAQTFKTHAAVDGGVRFESFRYPGRFLTQSGTTLNLTDGSNIAASTFFVDKLETLTTDPYGPMLMGGYPYDAFIPSFNIGVSTSPEAGGTVTGGGKYQGTVTGSGAATVYEKATAEVTAVANKDYEFGGWYEDGKIIPDADATYTFTADRDRTLVARFYSTIPAVTPSAFVTKLNGNKNDLTITVVEEYENGTRVEITETIKIDNNAAGTYKVGPYRVYVDTKGNTQIREIYIVK